jgi:hypothetical protein
MFYSVQKYDEFVKYSLPLFMQDFKIVHFTLGGLQLQEPSTFISDLILAIGCFVLGYKISKMNRIDNSLFFKFFIFMGISTFVGAFGHMFFHYGGKIGKYPSWIFATIATFFFCKAMINDLPLFFNKRWNWIIWGKAIVFLLLSLLFSKFIFIAIDSILSYLLFGGAFGRMLWKASRDHMRYIVYGTLVLIPSAFVFILDVNLHELFNRDDLSHFIILATIIFYYKGILERNKLVPQLV